MRTTSSGDVDRAYAVCRSLAPRGLWCSASLRRHLWAVHAFARVVEDAADGKRVSDGRRRLESLRKEFEAMDQEPPRHPVVLALANTVLELGLPREPFEDKLAAGFDDCADRRYASFAELLDHCRRSGAPAWRSALWVHGYKDEERLRLCDVFGAALRLAGLWTDLAKDVGRERVYIPEEDFRESGYSEGDLRMGIVNEPFRSLMKLQWKRTRSLLEEVKPLAGTLSWPLSWRVRVSWRRGSELLRRIHRLGFDTLRPRRSLGAWPWPRPAPRAAGVP